MSVTVTIQQNSPQANAIIEMLRAFDFVTFKEPKKAKALATPVESVASDEILEENQSKGQALQGMYPMDAQYLFQKEIFIPTFEFQYFVPKEKRDLLYDDYLKELEALMKEFFANQPLPRGLYAVKIDKYEGDKLVNNSGGYYVKIENHQVVKFIKDLQNIKGDLTHNYATIPVVYGESFAKKLITLNVLLCFMPIYWLLHSFPIFKLTYFLYFTMLYLLFFVAFLWKSQTQPQYRALHNMLRVILVMGVFSVILVKQINS